MTTPLVLYPNVTFARIDGTLSGLGWLRAPDRSFAPSLIPGEPEFASWSKPETDNRISYTFNPVVRLRAFVFYGERAKESSLEVARALPALETEDLRQLLQSDDPRTLLLGIFAARELNALETIDLLDTLTEHPHQMVADAARSAHAEMLPLWLSSDAEKEKHPQVSVLFPHVGNAETRRQTLRWLMRDYQESNKNIDAVIRSGLIDEDWEVRASAMLAAVRLGAGSVSDDVERAALVRDSDDVDETDRAILGAAQKLAVAHLLNKVVDKTEDDRHMLNCMLDRPVEKHDGVFRLINSLTEPVGDDEQNSSRRSRS